MELDDICLNKAGIMERSLRRMQEKFRYDPRLENFSIERRHLPPSLCLSPISEEVRESMIAMTAFRNIAIQEYQSLDLSVLRHIAESRWRSLVDFWEALGIRIRP